MKLSPAENDHGWTKNEGRLLIDTAPTLIHTARPDGFLDFFNQRLALGVWRWGRTTQISLLGTGAVANRVADAGF